MPEHDSSSAYRHTALIICLLCSNAISGRWDFRQSPKPPHSNLPPLSPYARCNNACSLACLGASRWTGRVCVSASALAHRRLRGQMCAVSLLASRFCFRPPPSTAGVLYCRWKVLPANIARALLPDLLSLLVECFQNGISAI